MTRDDKFQLTTNRTGKRRTGTIIDEKDIMGQIETSSKDREKVARNMNAKGETGVIPLLPSFFIRTAMSYF